MKKLSVYLIVLMLSLAMATSVSLITDKTEYDGGDNVLITSNQCVGTSFIEVLNPDGALVDLKTGNNNWVMTYNTLSDSADGKYTAQVTCTNGGAQKQFCVDAPGCLQTQVQPTSTPSGDSGGSGGGYGGAGCSAEWSCSSWSSCNAELKQTRSCTDLNGCYSPKTETKDCLQCEESWVCSLWSDCLNGANDRECYDENKCGTSFDKPSLRKSCQAVLAAGAQPKRITTAPPAPTYYQPSAVQKKSTFAQLWTDYGLFAVVGVVSVLLLILIIVLAIKLFKPKKMAFNLNELREWVRKEKSLGTSLEDIKQILEEHTGWTKEEIYLVLKDFQTQQVQRSGITSRPMNVKPMNVKPMMNNKPARNVKLKTSNNSKISNNSKMEQSSKLAQPKNKMASKPSGKTMVNPAVKPTNKLVNKTTDLKKR